MKPIDKDKVVAEIEKRIKETESMRPMVDPFWEGQISAFDSVLKILNTLETKEVDLDYIKKELDELIRNHNRDFGWGTLYDVATHFFELGLKTQKGEEVKTQEEFNKLMQSKEKVKTIVYTDSSSVGLCFTLDEIVKLVKNKKEDETNKLSEEDVNNLNRISLIIHEAGQVQNWWRDESLISREESNKLVNWLKSFYNKLNMM